MAVCCVSVLALKSNSAYFLSLIYLCADVNYKYFYAPFYSRQLWNFHFLESRTGGIDVGIICSVTLDGVFLQLTQSIEFRSVLSGFSIHAAKQNCGELSQLHVLMSPCWLYSCLCVLSNQAIHIVLTMASCAGWWLMLPCLPFHRDCHLGAWCLWFLLYLTSYTTCPDARRQNHDFFFF